MKFKTALTAAAAMTLATAAHAQVGPEVGATVYESQNGEVGGVIGTIKSMQDGIVVVDVDGMVAPLPAGAFGEGPEGPVIQVTKAQLVQMLQEQKKQAIAARDAALMADAMVFTPNAVNVGTIESVEGDAVVLAMPEGSVALVRDNFATSETGGLMVLYTQEQLISALNGATAAPEGDETADADAE